MLVAIQMNDRRDETKRDSLTMMRVISLVKFEHPAAFSAGAGIIDHRSFFEGVAAKWSNIRSPSMGGNRIDEGCPTRCD